MHSKDYTPVNTSGRCITQIAKMSIDSEYMSNPQLMFLKSYYKIMNLIKY